MTASSSRERAAAAAALRHDAMHERNAWTLDPTGSRRGVTGAATTAGTALPSRGLGGDRCGQRVCRRDGITFRVRILVLRL